MRSTVLTSYFPSSVHPFRRSFVACAYIAFLAALVLTSYPRRVGDGGEYLAIAMNLASGRAPSLSAGDLRRIERRFQEVQSGYEVVSLEMPALRGRDGRQDFPHFWLYPLLSVPALWIVSALGAHPNFAFAIANGALLVTAFVVLTRRAAPAIAALVLAGPVIWWADKAHGDASTVAALTIGFAWLVECPVWGTLAIAAAAAQNAALAPVWLIAALWTFKSRGMSLRTGGALAASALLVAAPAIYFQWRLGVSAPIAGWTAPHLPDVGELGAFIWDPNIGLIVNNPLFALAVLGVLVALLVRRRLAAPSFWLAVASALAMLAAFAQSVNVNHGGTPGMNRWTLWLMPVSIPLVADAWREGGARARSWLGALTIASILWSVAWFHPRIAESYKTPTRLAARIWSDRPGLNNPPVEIFAERISHAEPPVLPVATADCRKVLLLDGRWPSPCLPPLDPPEACTARGTICYANAEGGEYRFRPVRFPAGLDLRRNGRTWPASREFARHLRSALDQAGPEGLAPAPASQDRSMLRAAHGVGWTYALQSADRLFVYLGEPQAGATLTLRLPGIMTGSFIDLSTGATIETVIRGGGDPLRPWSLRVPAGRSHLALVLVRTGRT